MMSAQSNLEGGYVLPKAERKPGEVNAVTKTMETVGICGADSPCDKDADAKAALEPSPTPTYSEEESLAKLKRKRTLTDLDSASEVDEASDKFEAGLALKLAFLQEAVVQNAVQQKDLREALSLQVSGVANVFYELGAKYGYIKMFSIEATEELLSKCDEDGILQLDISPVEGKLACGLSRVEGDEELLLHVLEQIPKKERHMVRKAARVVGDGKQRQGVNLADFQFEDDELSTDDESDKAESQQDAAKEEEGQEGSEDEAPCTPPSADAIVAEGGAFSMDAD